jgi:hypothetical protein
MSNNENRSAGPQLETGPLVAGGVLAGAGVMLLLAGIAIGGSHLFSATRRWVRDMEVPPSELARQKWVQAKAAAVAGNSAWRDADPARA